MKYMKVKEKYGIMNLQIFAEEDGEGGDDSGEGDDQEEGSEEEQDEDGEERKFTQKDVDAAVEKRLARERRKWNKQQSKEKDGNEAGKEGADDSKVKAAEERARKAEEKNACYEAGVSKDSVEDVAALAHAYMEKDEELDLEEAIEKVLKKYPHFKSGANEPEAKDETKGRSWGQRQSGKGTTKMSEVERRFYELNPDLKP